ncbi:hypothetical protein ACET3X_002063 [Alternaria dauci]|uniref:AB hydrolase-1 domain-containing protein n=1 Tax=Alternaria dauci TaxID=48095 RepID=A0ABR3UZ31_9PLEO
MAAGLAELLDCEGIEKVVTVSHDLGSFLVSRFHTYQSKYISALAFMGIGYFAPGQDFNQTSVEVYNNITEAKLGYPLLGYWYYYNRPDRHVLMDTHLDSIYSLHFSHNMPNDWIENVAKVDGLESWLAADRRAEYGNEWVTNTTRAQWQATTRAQGGVESAQKWYKAMMRGINSADEDVGRSTLSGIIEQPTIFITAEKDPVAHPAEQLLTTVPYIPGLQIRTVDAGHFLQVEQAGEVNAHLNEFFESL